jgi:hypothetical protein
MRGPVKAEERRRIRRSKEIKDILQVKYIVKCTKSLQDNLVMIRECKENKLKQLQWKE